MESYRGARITITTSRSGSNAWTSRAQVEVPGQSAVAAGDEEQTYPSEDEAGAAALRAAVEAIDRGRVSTGKW